MKLPGTIPSATPPGVVPSVAVTPTAAQGKFVGCVYRYNKTRKKYVIYCKSGALAGFGQAVTPPPPEGLVEVAAVDAPSEAAGAQDAGQEDVPFYKKTWFWATVGGVAVVGTGGVFLWRRKSKKAAAAPAAFGRRYGYHGRRYSHGLGRVRRHVRAADFYW